jgi:hypothetical protein
MIPATVFVIMAGNFVLLIVMRFRETLCVFKCGVRISHLLRRHLALSYLYNLFH